MATLRPMQRASKHDEVFGGPPPSRHGPGPGRWMRDPRRCRGGGGTAPLMHVPCTPVRMLTHGGSVRTALSKLTGAVHPSGPSRCANRALTDPGVRQGIVCGNEMTEKVH